ncbi:MAG: monoamine oxidase, partial [Ilumatobacteraceae bacterium]
MAHTPLLTMLQGAVSEIAAEDDGTERRVGTDVPGGTSRRRFLAGAAAAGAAVAAWRIGDAAPVAAATGPRIVIVGGGLAGLTCAYQLRKAGFLAEVHEASPDRLGGRCWSIDDYFAEGQIAEHGGELIDQGHTEIRHLAQSLGLKLDNLLAAEQNGTEPRFWFDDGPYTYTQATSDVKGIWQKLKRDVQAAGYPTLYNLSTERGRQLDQMSIIDWINESVPGGITSRLGKLLDVAYNIEYGAECSDQSSLNLVYLLGFLGQGQLRILGPSNEKYHVRGGNDLIVAGLRSLLTSQITFGSALTAIQRRPDATFDITMRINGKNVTSRADKVVLALPFAVLRTLDIAKAGFSPVKLRAIRELGMGTNSKLNVQFTERLWRAQGVNGDTFADTGYQNTWEVTRAQPGAAGILVDYTGGAIGETF